MFIDDELMMADGTSPEQEIKSASPIDSLHSSPFALVEEAKTSRWKKSNPEFKKDTQQFAVHMLRTVIYQLLRSHKKGQLSSLAQRFAR